MPMPPQRPQHKPGPFAPKPKKPAVSNPRGAVSSPASYRPQPVPKVLQRKTHVGVVQPKPITPSVKTAPPAPPVKSAVVQKTRLYPNLHPGAVEPVNQGTVFRLNSFADQYRLHRVNSHGVNVPNQQYNFVRTREGDMLLHNRYRHPSIAEGKQVLYAGEVFFNNGKLEWWSNGSGHYQPGADDAGQASLPMDRFY
ncbi:MAG TPA: hypothetical protein VFR51_01660, partial [Pyrinomonadaceae bacterium]|nr:hypothetical protein [Pyrinomonadaceae bacterium]